MIMQNPLRLKPAKYESHETRAKKKHPDGRFHILQVEPGSEIPSVEAWRQGSSHPKITHFFDEADLLADRLATLPHGSLKASGASVELKQTLGLNYWIHVYHPPGSTRHQLYGDEFHIKYRKETVYLSGDSENTCCLLRRLEVDGITEYQVDGPTFEDVFIKIGEEDSSEPVRMSRREHFQNRQVSAHSSASLVRSSRSNGSPIQNLLTGKRTSIFSQAKVLLSKRFAIFRRSPMPYLAAVVIPIIAGQCWLPLDLYRRTGCNKL